jgi:hypothetical protein
MELTRRRSTEDREECWHIYYGDVRVGTIGIRRGVPVNVHQWGWRCGFYLLSQVGHSFEGTAAAFETARAEFEAAWQEYLPLCTEGDFEAYRRQEAWTAWKYAMREAHLSLPTQSSNGQARCFCGAVIDISGTDKHLYEAHRLHPQTA